MYLDDDGGLTKALRAGEINVVDLSGSLHKQRGILFETCPPQGHSAHGRIERVIRTMKDSFFRSGASDCRLTATGWSAIGKALERKVNDTPIGFLYEKSSKDGNPHLRILRPSSLKGMCSSDRAPSGLFTDPDEPASHFGKVRQCYDVWAEAWATSYVPLIANRSKWTDEDENLAANDNVYFMLEDKEFKADWRIGKVDSVKIGRDGKVREVNIAYKVMKDDSISSWTHNVVTRPLLL